MHFTLLDFDGVRTAISRRLQAQPLAGLDDRLLRDIGYDRDGQPFDSDVNPLPPLRINAVERLAPAMLLLLGH